MSVREQRRGFTLIELVIVVLVLGIIAAVAAPKMFTVTQDARENGTRQTLTTVRNAIELVRASTGSYPSAADLPTAVGPMLQGDTFPAPQVANTNNSIRDFTGTFSASGTEGWAYNATTGEFYVNDATYGLW